MVGEIKYISKKRLLIIFLISTIIMIAAIPTAEIAYRSLVYKDDLELGTETTGNNQIFLNGSVDFNGHFDIYTIVLSEVDTSIYVKIKSYPFLRYPEGVQLEIVNSSEEIAIDFNYNISYIELVNMGDVNNSFNLKIYKRNFRKFAVYIPISINYSILVLYLFVRTRRRYDLK